AIATLAEMFPHRVDLAIGSGQALNEHITGQPWPSKQRRNELLEESAHIIKALWNGEKVSRRGLVPVEQAYLWSRPEIPPRLFGAAVTDGTAQQVSAWADGLLTTSRPYDESVRIIKLFRSSDRDRRPAVCKIGLGYARASQEETLRQCHEQWRNACFANHVLTEVRTTEDFDEIGRKVRPEDLTPALRISSNLDDHLSWIRDDFRAGFDEVVVHNVGPQQSEFIDDFGKYILPQIR
ncbi:MAG TPA: LLM class flavin-dependent oxidoreductase, partial [Opitutaceae bacterium]|nr:LLM class flavin-dependent oxidoreductase [Opitutaceae bacterium]